MGEVNDSSRPESFSLMTHWLMKRFQSPEVGGQRKARSINPLPKIVISRGSNKSINSMASPVSSPLFKRPSPLVKTWSPPMSAPHNSTTTFWNSPICKSPPFEGKSEDVFRPETPKMSGPSKFPISFSVPCTPMQPDFVPTNAFMSPVFRFTQKNKIPVAAGLTPATSTAWSRSDLDSESVCGACGQHKYFGSRDLVGFVSTPPPTDDIRIQSAINSPELPPRRLKLRRTSSCRAPEKSETQILHNSATITKACSNIDVQKRSSSKTKRVQRTGSKERHKSTISLTRSWSINLDTFRIVRTESYQNADRKMSLNDTELRRQKEERRRSSILRLLCHEKSDSEKGDKCDTVSITDSNSEGEISNYSPEVTRANKFGNGDPFEDFKSTLESDSIRVPNIYGQIKLMFQYYNEKNEFHVTLLKGSNVAPGQTGTLGIYTKVCLMPDKIQRKVGDDKHDTRNPIFYEPFTFKMSLGELLQRQLRIKLYNKPGIFSKSEPIGECTIALYIYDLTAVTVIWQNLNKCKNQKVC